MKFLKLEFKNAMLIKEKSLKNMLGSNRFFHPINKLHVYNSICVLFDRTPKSQLRKTNDEHMPFYEDILEMVSNGYINIKCVAEKEKISTVKSAYDANLDDASQITWVDCKYVTGTLHQIFINQLSEILNKKENTIGDISFEDTVELIQSMGTKEEDESISYSNDKINDLIKWCKRNTSTAIANYISNKQTQYKGRNFGKRVYRGSVEADRYCGIMYIPISDNHHDELITHTKGFSNILDEGLVNIVDYLEILEDEIEGFTKIEDLNSVRKFSNFKKGVDISKTIYKEISVDKLEKSIENIIKKCGVLISDNQKEFDEMMKKISKIKNDDENKYVKKIAYKLNHFIETSVNKIYKK